MADVIKEEIVRAAVDVSAADLERSGTTLVVNAIERVRNAENTQQVFHDKITYQDRQESTQYHIDKYDIDIDYNSGTLKIHNAAPKVKPTGYRPGISIVGEHSLIHSIAYGGDLVAKLDPETLAVVRNAFSRAYKDGIDKEESGQLQNLVTALYRSVAFDVDANGNINYDAVGGRVSWQGAASPEITSVEISRIGDLAAQVAPKVQLPNALAATRGQ